MNISLFFIVQKIFTYFLHIVVLSDFLLLITSRLFTSYLISWHVSCLFFLISSSPLFPITPVLKVSGLLSAISHYWYSSSFFIIPVIEHISTCSLGLTASLSSSPHKIPFLGVKGSWEAPVLLCMFPTTQNPMIGRNQTCVQVLYNTLR